MFEIYLGNFFSLKENFLSFKDNYPSMIENFPRKRIIIRIQYIFFSKIYKLSMLVSKSTRLF